MHIFMLLIITIEKIPVNTHTWWTNAGVATSRLAVAWRPMCCMFPWQQLPPSPAMSTYGVSDSRVCLAMSTALTSAQKIGRDPKCPVLHIVYCLPIPQSMCGG